jgi:hypothetical protein
MPARSLITLYRKFEYRTSLLAQRCQEKASMASVFGDAFLVIHCDARAFSVVRLQTLWSHFCRELIAESAVGGYKTAAGVNLARSARVTGWASVDDAARRLARGRHPPWHLAIFSINAAHSLGIQNRGQVSLALGGLSPADAMLAVRNYLVHPNDATRQAYERTVAGLRMPANIGPAALLTATVTGGVTRFDQWISDLQQIAADAVQ